MEYFFVASMVIFAFLFAIWSKNDWQNMIIKAICLAMTIWAAMLSYNVFFTS